MKKYFTLFSSVLFSIILFAQSSDTVFKSYSKFDFIPGEQIIYFEDFSQDNVGDFPDKWNTNGSGEIVTIGNIAGKWLKTASEIKYAPMLSGKPFPENYTIEFDAIYKADDEQVGGNTFLALDIFPSPNGKSLDAESGTGIRFKTQGDDVAAFSYSDQQEGFSNSQDKQLLINKNGKVIHFSIWVQKQRCRLYVEESKIWDLPMLMPAGANCNAIGFFVGIYGEGNRDLFFSNIRIAVGAPDMRNKLLTEGKLVTHGIMFDVNSDKIKSESYGTLKEIAKVLTENADVKVKIMGHTDSDGADAANMDLSKRRAAAVKNALSKDFGIDAFRMQSDGKGESEPASPNTTAEGKANNRRVEFIKM
jgi:outer membrane protein OmpA-like peptidoglycan-associated protein